MAALIYAVLVLVFFYPVLQGSVISQTDMLSFISPWDTVKPDDLLVPSNAFLQDQSTEFLPFFLEAKRQLLSGTFPLWNPFIFTGTPLWANTQSALMFPLNVFHYVLPAPLGFTVSSLLKLFFGCFFTYVFIRRIHLSHWPAMFAGIAFGFCSFTVFWLNHPHTNVTILIPLCFYMVERLLASANSRNMWLYGMVVALTLIAGHVEIAFLTAAATGLYYLLRLIQLKQLSFKNLWLFFVVNFYGLMLAAILVLPFVEFLFHTAIWSERSVVEQLHVPAAGLINLLLGNLFVFDGWPKDQIGFHAFRPYVGAVGLPLVLFALLKEFKQAWPFLIVVVCSLAIAFGINPFYWLVKSLPIFNHIPLFYFSVLAGFGLAVLAAMGLHHCLNTGVSKKYSLIMFAVIVGVCGLLRLFWDVGGLAQFVQSEQLLVSAVHEKITIVFYLLSLVLLLMWSLSRMKRTVSVVLCLLVFADLFWHGFGWNPVVKMEHALPQETPAALAFIKKQKPPFRTAAYDTILKPSTNMLVQVHDVRGYDVPVIDRYHHFFNEALKGNDTYWYYDLFNYDVAVLPYFDMLNVRYLLSKKDLSNQLPDYIEPVYQDDIYIYQNHAAMGLAYVVNHVQWVETAKEALAAVLKNKENLSHWLVLEGTQEESIEYQDKTANNSKPKHHIKYKNISAQSIDLQVNVAQATWLVLSQAYYPGWVATVDGEETDIFAANYVLQAIKIPAGTHHVSFKYQPFSFTIGWMLSLVSLLFALWKIRKSTK